MTSLIEAAKQGDLERVKIFISGSENIDEALYYAALNDSIEVVWHLIYSGANIFRKNNVALKVAALNIKFDVIKYLTDIGVDVTQSGLLSLERSAYAGDTSVVKYLVSCGIYNKYFIDEGLNRDILDILLGRLCLEEKDLSSGS